MPIVRYTPFSGLQRIQQDLDKLWPSDWGLLPEAAPMNLYEEDGKLVAEVNLPNFNKEDIKVTADEGVLEVMAEHDEKEEEDSDRRYYLRESSNQYLRRVSLPEGVKTDKAEAEFKDGILKITMPSEEKRQARRITVQ